MQTENMTILNRPATKNLNNFVGNGSPERTEALRRIEAWHHFEEKHPKFVNPDGLIEWVEELEGGHFQYAYNHQADLIQITEANRKRTGFEYDAQRRLVCVNHSDGATTRYTYGENDRLIRIDDRNVVSQFQHDAKGRLIKIQRGNTGASFFYYDDHGRVSEARTAIVSTQQEFDNEDRIISIYQNINGVSVKLQMAYDSAGRLEKMVLPGSEDPICYQWDSKGRPQTVSAGKRLLAQFEYNDEQKTVWVKFANGVIEEARADQIDARPIQRRVLKDDSVLFQRAYNYSPIGQIIDDGKQLYDYDQLGRLVKTEDIKTGEQRRFSYDMMDNMTGMEDISGSYHYQFDMDNRLVQIQEPNQVTTQIDYDRFGRPLHRSNSCEQWTYRYNDAGQLLQVLHRGAAIVRFTYDHKGRLVLAKYSDRAERFIYGPADELLAVTDEKGIPLRLYVRTPLGLLAEIHGSVDSGAFYFLHNDDRGTCHRITDITGEVVARFDYSPFGIPLNSNNFLPIFKGRIWSQEIMMYYFGARWYDPYLGRFLTPDTYTGAPDDERIIFPLWGARRQVFSRAEILMDWLKKPRVRNRYAFCGNDPMNRVDPNGHWSFGGMLLSVLGAIWTLPNTLFGLLIELTCLIGEVVRWLLWLISFGKVTWETPGFDVAASDKLNAFALVFSGGWLVSSFSNFCAITFGNVFFIKKAFVGDQSIYKHELRHTNQYGWFGPFFHLGLPLFGIYEWDVILNNGYDNAWLERDARSI